MVVVPRNDAAFPIILTAWTHRLRLTTYDQNRIKITGAEVMQKMREGKPRIELNPSTGGAPASAGLPGGPNTIVVGIWMLQAGEDMVVAKRLRAVLQEAATA